MAKSKKTAKKISEVKKPSKSTVSKQKSKMYSDDNTSITVTTVLVAVLFTLTIVYALQSFIWS